MKVVFIKLTVLFLLSIIPVATFNYFIDPYGIFNNLSAKLWYELGREPNQHYAKMRHLINDDHTWDSYIFGASRVGKINPDLIPGGNYYNMNYSEGIPGEHLVDIKVLIEKGVPVKNVMIGLDTFSYTMVPEDHYDQMMRHPYDESSFKRFVFQVKYLYSPPRIGIINNIRSKDNRHYLINFNILGNGMQNLERVEARIEGNIEQHVNSGRFDKANIIPFSKADENKYMNRMEKTLQDILEIIKLSRQYQFNLYFLLNPTHKLYYLKDNPYHFLLFKEKLAQLTDYWDFTGFNSITNNNYYYYETSHYRVMVGDFILCRITNCNNVVVPEDFGVFITKENVSDHIRRQEDNLFINKAKKYGNDDKKI
jgi:hypothetical protein